MSKTALGILLLSLSGIAHAQDGPRFAGYLEKGEQWQSCVVAKATEVATTSKQTPDDIVTAFLEDCDFTKLQASALEAFSNAGLSGVYADRAAARSLALLQEKARTEARKAIVTARVKAGQ
jgi:hypothetical protein